MAIRGGFTQRCDHGIIIWAVRIQANRERFWKDVSGVNQYPPAPILKQKILGAVHVGQKRVHESPLPIAEQDF